VRPIEAEKENHKCRESRDSRAGKSIQAAVHIERRSMFLYTETRKKENGMETQRERTHKKSW